MLLTYSKLGGNGRLFATPRVWKKKIWNWKKNLNFGIDWYIYFKCLWTCRSIQFNLLKLNTTQHNSLTKSECSTRQIKSYILPLQMQCLLFVHGSESWKIRTLLPPHSTKWQILNYAESGKRHTAGRTVIFSPRDANMMLIYTFMRRN